MTPEDHHTEQTQQYLAKWRQDIDDLPRITVGDDLQQELPAGPDEIWAYAKEHFGVDDTQPIFQEDRPQTDHQEDRPQTDHSVLVKMFRTNTPGIYAQVKKITDPRGYRSGTFRSLVKLGVRANERFLANISRPSR